MQKRGRKRRRNGSEQWSGCGDISSRFQSSFLTIRQQNMLWKNYWPCVETLYENSFVGDRWTAALIQVIFPTYWSNLTYQGWLPEWRLLWILAFCACSQAAVS